MEKLTTIEKLKAYFKAKKKFRDSGCFAITKEIEKVIGFEEGELGDPLFWQRFASAVQDTYPDTDREIHHYTFGQPQEVNVTDEDNFSQWLEVHKHLTRTNGTRRILVLHHLPKFKEKILLRGLFGTYRGNKLHVFVFEESFGEEIPFLIQQNCENADDLKGKKAPSDVIPIPGPESQAKAPDNSAESSAENPQKNEVHQDGSEVPIQETESQAVAEPLPEVVDKPSDKISAEQPAESQAKAPDKPETQPEKPEIINEMPRLQKTKTRPTRNYIADAYGSGGFNTGVERKLVYKVYDKKDIPANAKFVATKIERDGVVDLGVPNYDYLKPNEKLVHLYEIPDAKK